MLPTRAVGCELAPWKEFFRVVDDVVKTTYQARHFVEAQRFIHAHRPVGTSRFNSSNQLRMSVTLLLTMPVLIRGNITKLCPSGATS